MKENIRFFRKVSISSKNINKQVILIFFSFFIVACSNHKALSLSVYKGSCNNMATKTSFGQLIKDPEKFNNKFIELEGIYRWHPEESAIYKSYNTNDVSNAIWVEFNDTLLIEEHTGSRLLGSKKEFDKIINKRMKIQGRFSYENKGHLEQYSGSISNICYLEVFKE